MGDHKITLLAVFWGHQAILKQPSPIKIQPRSTVQTPSGAIVTRVSLGAPGQAARPPLQKLCQQGVGSQSPGKQLIFLAVRAAG